jgi:hypothetical protein
MLIKAASEDADFILKDSSGLLSDKYSELSNLLSEKETELYKNL